MLSVSVGVCWLAIHHRPRIQVPFLAVGIVVTVLALAGAEVRARFSSITEYEHDPSAQSRLDGWRAGWEMAWDRPWFGVGARNTNLYLDRYGADVEGRTIHNQFLQMGASFGIPAMLVYLGVCATAFFSTRQVWTMTGAGRTDYQPGAPPIQAVQPDSPVLFYDRQWSYLALGIEGSLVIFLFGSIFLSLGVFELPWLLIAMAGSMPQLVREDLRHRLVHSNPKAESRSSQGHTCPAPSPVETNP
jgi:O-antigen ligase